MLLIPAIDLKDGKCVRLRQGRMEDADVFSDSPSDMAAQWVNMGASRLHLVDLDGAFAGEPRHADVVRHIRSEHPDLQIQVGGGIRDMASIEAYLTAGVDYVVIGTQAVRDPAFMHTACAAFPEQVMLGLDAKQGMLAVEGWAEVSKLKALDFVKQFEDRGVAAIVYTDISRDGMLQGINIEATTELARAVNIPVIASGGLRDLDDIKKLKQHSDAGISGVILGRALYEGAIDLKTALTLV